MQEHECLIDFIAVSPEARGKGVGAKLMRWAEDAGATILAETEAAAVAAHGVEMTLWVGDAVVRCARCVGSWHCEPASPPGRQCAVP